jgi:hypothetical protein
MSMNKTLSKEEQVVDKYLSSNADAILSLSNYKINQLKTRWRKIYSLNLFKTKKVWRYNLYDWHVFSWELTQSISDHKAISKALGLKDKEWYVWGDRDSSFGVKVIGITPCNLSNLYEDFILSAIDLSWTIAFTHEQCCGPYYCDKKLANFKRLTHNKSK